MVKPKLERSLRFSHHISYCLSDRSVLMVWFDADLAIFFGDVKYPITG